MTTLSKEQSRQIITEFYQYVKYPQLDFIDKYLDSKTYYFRYLLNFEFSFHSPPDILDFEDGAIRINHIYPSILPIKNSYLKKDDDKYSTTIFASPLFEKFSQFLIQNKISSILSIGDWQAVTKLPHRVIGLAPQELPTLLKQNWGSNSNFFPEDKRWALIISHNEFSLIAGQNEFINSFFNFYPGVKQFLFDINQTTCPFN